MSLSYPKISTADFVSKTQSNILNGDQTITGSITASQGIYLNTINNIADERLAYNLEYTGSGPLMVVSWSVGENANRFISYAFSGEEVIGLGVDGYYNGSGIKAAYKDTGKTIEILGDPNNADTIDAVIIGTLNGPVTDPNGAILRIQNNSIDAVVIDPTGSISSSGDLTASAGLFSVLTSSNGVIFGTSVNAQVRIDDSLGSRLRFGGTNEIGVNSARSFTNTNFTPTATNTYTLGENTTPWLNVYSTSGSFLGPIYASGSATLAGGRVILGDGNAQVNKDVTTTGINLVSYSIYLNLDGQVSGLLKTNAYGLSSSYTSPFVLAAANGFDITGSTAGAITPLVSSGGAISSSFIVSNNFSHTMTEDTTLANPTNVRVGQSGMITITQHSSSAKTLSYDSYWKWPSGSVGVLTTTTGAVDILAYYVMTTSSILLQLITDVK